MNRFFIKKNVLSLSIILFCLLFGLINVLKPNILYNQGEIRPFGINYTKTTVTPLWLITIFLAVVSYLSMLYVKTLK